MRSEKEKMLGGELYDPLDPQLSAERRRARLLCKALNDTRDDQQKERARLIKELIPASSGAWPKTFWPRETPAA
jgi:maltose O-acetyltransferase